VSTQTIPRLASIKDVPAFEARLRSLGINIPCDSQILTGTDSPLRKPLVTNGLHIGNRIAVQPMEGWDAEPNGNPSELTLRRWQRFGSSGAKLIWGGEAVAVCHSGRANPNQVVAATHTEKGLEKLREGLIREHRKTTGSDRGLIIGVQLTHSGRYCRPNDHKRAEPRILYHHPLLDSRLKLPADFPVLTDGEIRAIIEDFHRAAVKASNLGFDFVDVKHCHGYLGHEFLSAYTRNGAYGGSFENRTRFLREIVEGVRSLAPKLHLGVRLSAFDSIPFRPDPTLSSNGQLGPGIPESADSILPYRWGFGVRPENPVEWDLQEPVRFLSLLQELGIHLVNLTAGSPYYNPHIQRPALFPPSDGYAPPEDPLVGVARQMCVTRSLKQQFPALTIVGSGYSYMQEFLPNVAQAAVREGWVDCIGIGRMVLSYPEILWHSSGGQRIERKRICRTFSDCTTAPRNGLPSGCYPLDSHYKDSEFAERLKSIKEHRFASAQEPAFPMNIDSIIATKKPRRRVQGIAAALLPFLPSGEIAVEAFQLNLQATHACGLMNAVNMDTGYVNHLTEDEKGNVLRWTREALGGGKIPFVAGVYIEGQPGEIAALYRKQLERIVSFGGIPILFQTARLHGETSETKARIYSEICEGFQHVLAFELGPMFAPNGEIFDEDTARRIMDIPAIKGMKHSSLDRLTELARLRLRDQHRPDFRIYTGNDLGIDMIEYGSDYLLGLACFAPEKFAERDRLWECGDARYYALSDALQHLGNVAFRAPVPAYKHSAALFLHLAGKIPSDRTHPRNPGRPTWEREILLDCARRLGFPARD